jgi:hypothetical protein
MEERPVCGLRVQEMIHNGRQRRLEKLEFAIWHCESWALFVYSVIGIASARSILYTHSAFSIWRRSWYWMAIAAQVFFCSPFLFYFIFVMMNEYSPAFLK